MAVLEMLAEMVCPEKLLRRITFTEFMCLLQVADTLIPILVGSVLDDDAAVESAFARTVARSSELISTVAADVCLARVGS